MRTLYFVLICTFYLCYLSFSKSLCRTRIDVGNLLRHTIPSDQVLCGIAETDAHPIRSSQINLIVVSITVLAIHSFPCSYNFISGPGLKYVPFEAVRCYTRLNTYKLFVGTESSPNLVSAIYFFFLLLALIHQTWSRKLLTVDKFS